jgi:hypothetical protein
VLNTFDALDDLNEDAVLGTLGAGAGVEVAPWSLVLLRRIQ